MATKNNRRVLVTKKIFKESLLSLMKEKPISKISIKEICDLSEMSRSTFYLHYQDQFELLNDIENEVVENTFEALTNLDGTNNTKDSIEAFLNYVKNNRDTFGILLCQNETRDFQEAILEKILIHIKEAIPDLNKATNNDYSFTFVMYGCLNVLRKWILNDFDIPTSQFADFILTSCISALIIKEE